MLVSKNRGVQAVFLLHLPTFAGVFAKALPFNATLFFMNNPAAKVNPILAHWKQQFPPLAQIPWAGVFTTCYFAWFYGVVGLRPEHTAIYFLLVGLYTIHEKTRHFLFAFAIFLLYVVVFDSLRMFPNYLYNTVHIEDLYNADKSLFGINYGTQRLTLNEYAQLYRNPIADVLSGVFYVSWVPVPLLFATYLFFNNKTLCLRFLYGFVFTTFIGVAIYYLYPAAPPWYVEEHGFRLLLNTRTNPAGLLNFDEITGIPLFKSIYSNGPMPFAAMPSKHAAFPLFCFLYGRKLKKNWLNAAFLICTAGIWFSAIYTQHHYVLDVLAGGLLAVTGYLLFERIMKTNVGQRCFNRLLKQIGG